MQEREKLRMKCDMENRCRFKRERRIHHIKSETIRHHHRNGGNSRDVLLRNSEAMSELKILGA